MPCRVIEVPMVIRISVSIVAPLASRIVPRSASAPSAAVRAVHATNTAGSGTPAATRVVAVIAPIIRYSPWAKLMMPVTLLMITKPTPTIA
jgi:hypothetical protein